MLVAGSVTEAAKVILPDTPGARVTRESLRTAVSVAVPSATKFKFGLRVVAFASLTIATTPGLLDFHDMTASFSSTSPAVTLGSLLYTCTVAVFAAAPGQPLTERLVAS